MGPKKDLQALVLEAQAEAQKRSRAKSQEKGLRRGKPGGRGEGPENDQEEALEVVHGLVGPIAWGGWLLGGQVCGQVGWRTRGR